MDKRSSAFWYLLSSRSDATSCSNQFRLGARFELNGFWIYLDDFGEIFAAHVVVRFEEDFPESTLTDRVVLGVELVESVERVAILNKSIHWLEFHRLFSLYSSDPLEDSLRILGGFLEDSWRILGGFLEDFWGILGGYLEGTLRILWIWWNVTAWTSSISTVRS